MTITSMRWEHPEAGRGFCDEEVFRSAEPFDFFPGDDQAPGVLLLHGFTGTPAEVRYLGESLMRSGVGAHCPLLRGHGTSVEDLSKTTWHDWLESAEEKCSSLGGVYRPENFFIGGLSMGALLAIRLYVHYPGKFAGLIVMGVPFKLSPLIELVVSSFKLLPKSLDLKLPKLCGPDVMDGKVRNALPCYRRHSLRAAVSLVELARKVRREDLPQIEGPVLLLHGKFDLTAPFANIFLFKNEAVRARITSRLLKRSGHLIPVDHDRDLVAEFVLDFIMTNLRNNY